MDTSEKGIITQNLRTLFLILLCMGLVVYWVPNLSLWNAKEREAQSTVQLPLKNKELRQFINQIDILKDHELPLIYTDTPKELALELISEFKKNEHFDAYRVWLNPNDIEIKIYYDEFLL